MYFEKYHSDVKFCSNILNISSGKNSFFPGTSHNFTLPWADISGGTFKQWWSPRFRCLPIFHKFKKL